jgi:hypothetical protein
MHIYEAVEKSEEKRTLPFLSEMCSMARGRCDVSQCLNVNQPFRKKKRQFNLSQQMVVMLGVTLLKYRTF